MCVCTYNDHFYVSGNADKTLGRVLSLVDFGMKLKRLAGMKQAGNLLTVDRLQRGDGKPIVSGRVGSLTVLGGITEFGIKRFDLIIRDYGKNMFAVVQRNETRRFCLWLIMMIIPWFG